MKLWPTLCALSRNVGKSAKTYVMKLVCFGMAGSSVASGADAVLGQEGFAASFDGTPSTTSQGRGRSSPDVSSSIGGGGSSSGGRAPKSDPTVIPRGREP